LLGLEGMGRLNKYNNMIRDCTGKKENTHNTRIRKRFNIPRINYFAKKITVSSTIPFSKVL